MSEFLPARQDQSSVAVRDFFTERDGESRCYTCGNKAPGRVHTCEASHDHILLRTCQKIEGGAVMPVKDYMGRFTDVRMKKSAIKDVVWTPENEKVGAIIQSGLYYEILELQPNTPCMGKSHTWSIEGTYKEQQDVLGLLSFIDNDHLYSTLTPQSIGYYTHLVSRYRNVFSKDQILRFVVASNEGTAMQVEHLSRVVQELADRVVGAGNNLLGRL